MDILYLLDRLEETLTSGTHVPFTSRTLIDEQEALDILDQIRVAIPEEIKQARRLMAERDNLIAEAADEAERIARKADAQRTERLSEHTLVLDAERRADEIRRDALRAAERLRGEADAYAFGRLTKVHAQLQVLVEQVERGLQALEGELASSGEEEEIQAVDRGA